MAATDFSSRKHGDILILFDGELGPRRRSWVVVLKYSNIIRS